MKPIAKMDVMSWELEYDNALLDENGKVLNISEFATKYSADFICKRLPRFYLYKGELYLAPDDSQCYPTPHPTTP